MAQDGIISDNDQSVTLESQQDGLLVTAACPRCGRHVRVMHPWPELQALMQNRQVGGYQPVRGGWVITVNCSTNCLINAHQRATVSYRLSVKDIREHLG